MLIEPPGPKWWLLQKPGRLPRRRNSRGRRHDRHVRLRTCCVAAKKWARPIGTAPKSGCSLLLLLSGQALGGVGGWAGRTPDQCPPAFVGSRKTLAVTFSETAGGATLRRDRATSKCPVKLVSGATDSRGSVSRRRTARSLRFA